LLGGGRLRVVVIYYNRFIAP
jgi:hypothetical protein